MKLSILCLNLSIPGYSTTEKYHAMLESLFAHPPKEAFEVIMVDNGSTDNAMASFQERWGDKITHYLPLPKNVGFQRGNNEGVRMSEGEYLMFMNPDITVTEGMMDGLIAYMDAHPIVAVTGPQLVYPSGVVQDSYRRFMKPLDSIIKRIKTLHRIPYFKKRMMQYLLWKVDNTKVQEIDWIVGACMIVRKRMFDEIGGYDNRFFLFNGDTDLCRQFWKKGWKVIYNPMIKAGHKESRLSGNGFWDALFKKTAWIHVFDMIKYFLKWGMK